ncbi:MAG: TonB-dependent receptor [Hydrogenovibrio sp.]|uniref:TonB-dependent receptor n=1 Tax=Hydrogenovibrio sp. TaxID=2065821 RepID=UPI00287006F0|nr:TonB-dependent receptor [Hydrogenovibrio sp.]MDR9498850.1 TonB-dependent receptor [Hydrogenovibrio sp.]
MSVLRKKVLAQAIAVVMIQAAASNAVVLAEPSEPVASSQTELAPVTVSASPIHQHQAFDVPSQINGLEGGQKRAEQSGSLGETLDGIAGVNNLGTGAQSGKPVIRGMSGNRVKVLSNGQATDFQTYGVRHQANIDPFLAERLEVVRGPQSVLYGSEALGGVVNVLSPAIPYGRDTHGEVMGEYGSQNREKVVGAKLGAGGENFGLTAGYVQRKADNMTVPDEKDRALLTGEVPYTNYDNRSTHIGLGYDDDWGYVELRHTQWVAKQNFVGIHKEGDHFHAEATGQRLQNDETQLKTGLYLGDWTLKADWSHTQNRRESAHDLPYETMAADKGTDDYLDLRVKRDDVTLALAHPKLGDFEGEVGVSLTEKEQTLKSGHLAPSTDVSQQAVYLFEEADYDRWLVQFGARYDRHEVKAPINEANHHFVEDGFFDDSNNERTFDVVTGSLGATYRLADNWALAGSLARGYRAPSIFELYAGGEHGGVQAFQIGNPDLKEETSINTDLSLRWQGEQAQASATVYQNWVDNYIYLERTGNTVTGESGNQLDEMQAQQTDAQIRGLELAYQQRFTPRWSADAALEIIEGRDTDNSRDLPLIPANNLRLVGHFHPADGDALKNQTLSLGVKLVASKDAAGQYEPFSQFDDSATGTASTDAYSVWDLGYQADVKWDKRTLKLGAKVENLFDTAYVDFLNTYKGYSLNPGRNFQLNAALQF